MALYCLSGAPHLAIKADVCSRVWHSTSKGWEHSQRPLMASGIVITDKVHSECILTGGVSHSCLCQMLLGYMLLLHFDP